MSRSFPYKLCALFVAICIPFVCFFAFLSVRPASAEVVAPAPDDITFTSTSISFNNFSFPTVLDSNVISAPTFDLDMPSLCALNFTYMVQEGSTVYFQLNASTSATFFGTRDRATYSNTSTSTYDYNFYSGGFFSLSKYPSSTSGNLLSTEIGYYLPDSEFNWIYAYSYTSASDVAPLSNIPYGRFVAFSTAFFVAHGSSAPPARRYFLRFGMYVPARFNPTDILYYTHVPVDLGSVAPDGTSITSGLSYSTNAFFPATRLASLVFYNTSGNPVLYLYYPYAYYKFINYSKSVDYSFAYLGLTRYSSYSVDGSASWSQAYSQGYTAGNAAGNSSGYNDGYSAGNTSGYENGYSVGFTDGADASNQYTFFNLISSVLSAPIGAITSLLNFDVLGFNMSSFFLSLLTIAIVAKIVMVVT